MKAEKMMMVLAIISVLIIASLTLGCASPTPQPGNNTTPTAPPTGTKQYTIGTGGIGGTYYIIGTGLCNSINNASAGIFMTPETTGASVQNCQYLQNHTVDFALIQTDVGNAAANGNKIFAERGKLGNIEGVAVLYPETIQIITKADSGIKNVTDLKGKRVVMGDRGSGSWYDALDILAAYGMNESDVQPSAVKLAQAVESMKNGQVDAAFWTGGAPTAAITEFATTSDIYIVPITGDARDKLFNISSFFKAYTLPGNTYRGVANPTETVTVMSMLVVNKDVPVDDVYNMCKAMYDGKAPITSYPNPNAAKINKTAALVGLTVPLHPGAQKYFDEQGIKAP